VGVGRKSLAWAKSDNTYVGLCAIKQGNRNEPLIVVAGGISKGDHLHDVTLPKPGVSDTWLEQVARRVLPGRTGRSTGIPTFTCVVRSGGACGLLLPALTLP
jgi:hypothetical protein